VGSFKDNQERTWSIDLTVGAVKRIRSVLSIDLLDLRDDTFTRLASDILLMHDLVWLLCEEQATKRGIGEEEFGAAVVGDPLSDAIGVVMGAIPGFFHAAKKSLITTAVQKSKAMREKAEELTAKTLADTALDQRIEAAMSEGIKNQVEQALTQLSSPTNLLG